MLWPSNPAPGQCCEDKLCIVSGRLWSVRVRCFGAVVAWFVAVERSRSLIEDTRDFLGGTGAKGGDIRDSDKRVVASDTGNICLGPVECVDQFWPFKRASLPGSRGRPLFLASSSLLAPYRPTTSTLTPRNPPPYHNTGSTHTCNHGRPLRSFAPLCDHHRRTTNHQLRVSGLY